MTCLYHFNAAAGYRVTVTGNDKAVQVALPVIFHGFGHSGRSFACADDNSAAFRRRRKVRRNASRRRGGHDSFVKQSDKKFPRGLHGSVNL